MQAEQRPLPQVTVQPKGIRFVAGDGQTVMAAASAAGYQWPTVCGGEGMCRVCFIEVLDHPERLSEPDARERAAIAELSAALGNRGHPLRLACQAMVRGDVAVHKRGVRAAYQNPSDSGGARP